MELNDFLTILTSIIATFISVLSLFLTYENKKEQQKLEKEMQQNEFNFSRKKVWYEKQNEILDTATEKLIDNFSKLQLMNTNLQKQNEIFEQSKNELLEEIDTYDEGKLNKTLSTMSDEEILKKMDQVFEEKIGETMKKINDETIEQGIGIYENFLYLRSYKHYFSESMEEDINAVLRLTSKILRYLKEEKIEEKEFNNYLDLMKIYIKKITDEIRREFLYL